MASHCGNRAELQRLDAAAVKPDKINSYEVLARLKERKKQNTSGRFMNSTLSEPLQGPMPVLKPAEVVLIWIAPWTDRKGDLHLPGYIFSEITPRRWSFGEAEIDDAPIVAP